MQKQPVMFISHGAPTFALDTVGAASLLREAGRYFTEARAVIILSAHWMSAGLRVNANPTPDLIYDFGGFPPELYEMRYAARGDADLAATVAGQFQDSVGSVTLDHVRGWDHGVWVPLRHLLPDAQIPIIQISLPQAATPKEVFSLGRVVRKCRDQGFAVIGSGSLTHNFADMRFGATSTSVAAHTFQSWVRERLREQNADAIINADKAGAIFAKTHPTDEHYMPLVFALGAVDEADQLSVLEGGISHRALSMESYLWRSSSEF